MSVKVKPVRNGTVRNGMTIARSLRSVAMTTTALSAGAFVIVGVAVAEDQAVSDRPAASTEMMPEPTLTEQMVYLRDAMALATLRLDEAEQTLARQSQLIELQNARIADLERQLGAAQSAIASAAAGRRGSLAAAPYGMRDYRVVRGDSLSKIAQQNRTTVRALAQANNLRAPYRLDIGQRILVPADAPAADARIATAPVVSAPPAETAETKQAEAAKIAQAAPAASPAKDQPCCAARTAASGAPEFGASRRR